MNLKGLGCAIAAVLVHITISHAQTTWCGKNYMASQPIVPPGGQFPIPSLSSTPLIAFRCSPAIKPYLAEDTQATIVVDTSVTFTQIAGAVPIQLPSTGANGQRMSVVIEVDGKSVATGTVALNTTGTEFTFPLASLTPRTAPFNLTCLALSASGVAPAQTFQTSSSLAFLPDPPTGIGSVTKLDLRTGALLRKDAPGGVTGQWETVFPIGFYTDFGGYLAKNLSVLDELKAQGFTLVHPVPTFDNMTAFTEVVDRMEQLGLYLMYDMRFTYTNLTSVTSQVTPLLPRRNILLWYTGDEPDGTSDPLTAPSTTSAHLTSLDPYRPVSLVLNCADYFFTEYVRGGDIIMEDVYPVGINATQSVRWGTACTSEFGDCGCDDCVGGDASGGWVGDVGERVGVFRERLEVLGERKAVWGVTQAFGGSEYWSRAPTGNEWLSMSVLAINRGARGIVPWNDPTPADIKLAASTLAKALTSTIKTFLFDPHASFVHATIGTIDVAAWTSISSGTKRTLVLATNIENVQASASLDTLLGPIASDPGTDVTMVLRSTGDVAEFASRTGRGRLVILDGFATIGFVLEE